MIKFEQFTGGVFDTNAFLLRGPAGNVLIDAPQGADLRFASEKIDTLLLTHGHFDHIIDAAAIQRRHGCPVAVHAGSRAMVTEAGFFVKWGFQLEIEPATADIELVASTGMGFGGLDFTLLEVPGHCPGSICFYLPSEGIVFGGDALFAGGIGRWDLPGGDKELLLAKIHSELLTLPDETVVYPGHGPSTTIGHEKASNPFLQG